MGKSPEIQHLDKFGSLYSMVRLRNDRVTGKGGEPSSPNPTKNWEIKHKGLHEGEVGLSTFPTSSNPFEQEPKTRVGNTLVGSTIAPIWESTMPG